MTGTTGKTTFLLLCALLVPGCGLAQTSLPDDPATANLWARAGSAAPPTALPDPQNAKDAQASMLSGRRLSLKDAEQIALRNNPAISVARLSALASQQTTREVRSSLWPAVYANLTA